MKRFLLDWSIKKLLDSEDRLFEHSLKGFNETTV